jgi:uncharacterized protein (DUF488 family)
MNNRKPVLFTVGHSNHSFEHFVDLLKSNEVKAIADVRSSPYSKYTPQFNRDSLERVLKENGIYYVFLGRELGARRDEPECYAGNKVVYSKVAKTNVFQEGLFRLREGALRMRVAVMCAEKDPLTCHRTVLVARYGRDFFSEIHHILDDGSIETGHDADCRLLAEYKLDKEDFFSPLEERMKIAYEKRAEKIAYEETEEVAAHG